MLLSLFKSLADETRLRLLNLLSRGEFTVQELTEILAMGQSRISRHLKILHDAGLLAVKRQGTWSYYRVAPASDWIEQFWQLLIPQLQQLVAGPTDLVRMTQLFERQKSANREFFDRHARQWDLLKQNALPLVAYRDELFQLLGAGQLLVEVGIGTGELLAGLTNNWQSLIGIDQSQAMLDEARNRFRAQPESAIELRLGEMTALPVADSQADAVLMNMVLHHAPQPRRVLADAARILVPGGRLVIAELLRHNQDWTREALADVWLGFAPEELTGWLNETGFTNIDIKRLPPQGQLNGILLAVASQPKTN
ncbi:MAG TPA: metalloregulator ArsR/SmtB family transcription factor [Geothermobacteraceae bacterium]|nr:metalloregulator ArsR/SmtB family transcription factor [Geothermobacteraceae bacterium]